jgi:3-deoxy-manno-octulosonate cytidylyltransferase (CMP-KDO synthetase)
MPNILGVIPARFASQRFPGKPLALISGRPMIQWIYEASCCCRDLADVVVATDDVRIAEVVSGFGGQVVMTSSDHQTGTDRVAEVAANYENVDAVANIQGDQPFVTAAILERLVAPYASGELPDMTTVACPIDLDTSHDDPNTVKVVCDQNMDAIYFSRAAIPHFRNQVSAPVYHHLGLYAFSRRFLTRYAEMRPTPLEQCEALEQLRVLEHGHRIRVMLIDAPIVEVNTPEDLELANQRISAANDNAS